MNERVDTVTLRRWVRHGWPVSAPDRDRTTLAAADEIDALRARVAELESRHAQPLTVQLEEQ